MQCKMMKYLKINTYLIEQDCSMSNLSLMLHNSEKEYSNKEKEYRFVNFAQILPS